jgi:hypothetical protein
MVLGILQVVGMSAAFALGGKLIVLLGVGPDSWRRAMLWLSVPIGLVLVLTFWVREPEHRLRDRTIRGWRTVVVGLWGYRRMFIPLAFGQVIVGMGSMAALVWTAPILTRRFGLAPDRTGALIGAVLLFSGLVGPLIGGLATDFCQRTGGLKRTLSLAFLLALLLVPASFYAVLPSVFWLGALLFVLYTLSCVKGIACSAATTIAIPAEFLGLAMGVICVSSSIFWSIAPVAVSELAGRLGGEGSIGKALTIVSCLTSVAAAISFAVGRRYFPGRTETSIDNSQGMPSVET